MGLPEYTILIGWQDALKFFNAQVVPSQFNHLLY